MCCKLITFNIKPKKNYKCQKTCLESEPNPRGRRGRCSTPPKHSSQQQPAVIQHHDDIRAKNQQPQICSLEREEGKETLSVSGSLMRRTSSELGRTILLYSRLSMQGLKISTSDGDDLPTAIFSLPPPSWSRSLSLSPLSLSQFPRTEKRRIQVVSPVEKERGERGTRNERRMGWVGYSLLLYRSELWVPALNLVFVFSTLRGRHPDCNVLL